MKLVLAVGQHDPAYVDAYYGPPEWKAEAENGKRPLADIDADAARLIEELGQIWSAGANTAEQADRETSCRVCGTSTCAGSSRRCGRGSACCQARS